MLQDPQYFSKLLITWRREQGWTQQQVAEALDCDRSQVAQWEGGARMGDEYIAKLARLTGVKPQDLLAIKYALTLQRRGIDITSLMKHNQPLDSEESHLLALKRADNWIGLISWATRKIKSQDAKNGKDAVATVIPAVSS